LSGGKIPILLDTDIGSDIDDAVALAYLLKHPECELLGITTVTGQAQQRAQLADALCRAFGRHDVPIYSGADNPLIIPQKQTDVPQAKALAGWDHKKNFPANEAVDFLRRTIYSHPGKVTLLSIGPLTNIGILFALDPQIPRLLKQHVMMGGLYSGGLPDYGLTEWNTSGDPHATAIVLAAEVPMLRCVGLEVTTRCKLSVDECRKRFSQGSYRIIADMAEVWFEGRSEITFHDPLAAATVFHPDLCIFESGLIEVELQNTRLLGKTGFTKNIQRKPHHVAMEVDTEAFFHHYFDICPIESTTSE